jgi:hypothetical protein
MRIYLKVKYEERFKAKSLGCRWDYEAKLWFIENPDDLSLFKQWMPEDVQAFYSAKPKNPPRHMKAKVYAPKKPVITGPKVLVPLCNCNVPPWEDCEHTDALAHKAMLEMTGQVTS